MLSLLRHSLLHDIVFSAALCEPLLSPQPPTAAVSSTDLQLIQTILRWPPEKVFPGGCSPTNCMNYRQLYAVTYIAGLDLLRLALLNDHGSSHFIGDADNGKVFLGELLAFAV